MTTARALTARLASLLATEHDAMADFIVALADFDRRRLWVELGYTSLFYYLHRELGLSKGAAFHRKVAAELLQRFPEVIEPLRDGRLCLSSVAELAKALTPDNRSEVLPRFFHCSAREAREVLAELCPRADPPRRELVTTVKPPQVEVTRKLVLTSELDSTATAIPHAIPSSTLAAGVPLRDTSDPLTADLRRLHITVSRRFLEKLDAARDGLSHAVPGADAEKVLEAALDLLLAKQAKRKGLVERPRKEPSPVKADHVPSHVPAHVRREVWLRDGGRCQWPVDSGGTCASTLRLELDHIVPRARGGPSIASNIRVVCRVHNGLAARQAFGDRWMDRFSPGMEPDEAPAAQGGRGPR